MFNDKEKYPNILRIVSDDSELAKAITDLIHKYNWSTVMCLCGQGINILKV